MNQPTPNCSKPSDSSKSTERRCGNCASFVPQGPYDGRCDDPVFGPQQVDVVFRCQRWKEKNDG